MPSFSVVAGLESESVLRLERDWSRSRVKGRGLQLLQVGGIAALCMSFKSGMVSVRILYITETGNNESEDNVAPPCVQVDCGMKACSGLNTEAKGIKMGKKTSSNIESGSSRAKRSHDRTEACDQELVCCYRSLHLGEPCPSCALGGAVARAVEGLKEVRLLDEGDISSWLGGMEDGLEYYGEICGFETSKTLIMGGVEAEYRDWPSVVAIYKDGEFICGGTVLDEDTILTAGHCLHGYESSPGHFYTVRAGMVRKASRSPWEQHRTIAEVIIHPQYNKVFLDHDLSLGRLNSSLHLNRHVSSSCLPQHSQMYPAVGSTCIATGWGDLSDGGAAARQLMQGEVPVRANCSRSYNNMEYQICGGYLEGGKDSCQGDSGGPLYCQTEVPGQWYLAGVISHGKGCGRANEAGVYVRLSYYRDWLQEVLSDWESSWLDQWQQDSGKSRSLQEDWQGRRPLATCPGLHCGSGECVRDKYVCDNKVDCLDGGDVQRCTTLANGTRLQLEEGDIADTEVEPLAGEEQYRAAIVTCRKDQWKCAGVEQCVMATARYGQ